MVERTRIARAFAPHPALLMALAACVVGFLVIGLGAALGPLPPGAAALAWVYLVAATVTAVAVTSWMAILADPFSRALLVTYTAAAVTTVLTLAAWLPLFFGAAGSTVAGRSGFSPASSSTCWPSSPGAWPACASGSAESPDLTAPPAAASDLRVFAA